MSARRHHYNQRKDLGDPSKGWIHSSYMCQGVQESSPFLDREFLCSELYMISFGKQKLREGSELFFKSQMASGMQRYFTVLRKWLYGKYAEMGIPHDHPELISTETTIKILRKFNKCMHGMVCDIKWQKSKRNFENLQLEELKSSCLGELMAFQIKTREKNNRTTSLPGQLEECKLQTSTENQLVLSITLCNSRVLAVDLTCSICLETLFDPVSLTCSHIFCYMCACSAGSVNTTIDGLKSANPKSKCPLCRKAGVFEGAVRMHQLRKLLRRSFQNTGKNGARRIGKRGYKKRRLTGSFSVGHLLESTED